LAGLWKLKPAERDRLGLALRSETEEPQAFDVPVRERKGKSTTFRIYFNSNASFHSSAVLSNFIFGLKGYQNQRGKAWVLKALRMDSLRRKLDELRAADEKAQGSRYSPGYLNFYEGAALYAENDDDENSPANSEQFKEAQARVEAYIRHLAFNNDIVTSPEITYGGAKDNLRVHIDLSFDSRFKDEIQREWQIFKEQKGSNPTASSFGLFLRWGSSWRGFRMALACQDFPSAGPDPRLDAPSRHDSPRDRRGLSPGVPAGIESRLRAPSPPPSLYSENF